MPTGKPQVLRGLVGIVVPDRAALLQRLAAVKKPLAGTSFDVHEHDDYVEAISALGQSHPLPRARCTLRPHHARHTVCAVRRCARHARRIVNSITGCSTRRAHRQGRGRPSCGGRVGPQQDLIFRESDRKPAAYDGHHIAIYVADFSGPHRRLLEKGLISEESDQHQYRFENITDTESGKVLFTVEHEVRSLRHPLYARPLVNRNPAQTNRD